MRRLLVGALAVGLGAGCAAVRQPPVARFAGPLPDAAALTAALAHQRAARTSLRAVARLAYDSPDGRGQARQVMLAERPGRLRIEVLSAFGSVFVLTANDGALAAYLRSEATLYRGRASRENLWRYARVNLDVADAVAVLLGTPPPRAAGHEVVSLEPGSDTIQLWREVGRGAQVIWFNAALLPVVTEDRDADGQVLLRARFGDFTTQLDMPRHIDIELPTEARRLTLDLRDLEVNPTLAASLFTLPTPPGITEIRLDDSAEARS